MVLIQKTMVELSHIQFKFPKIIFFSILFILPIPQLLNSKKKHTYICTLFKSH